ncbi:hypothetical protein COU05_01845 [bacterium (Candidatus Gribaldobacteria) CG10_big_fil_rev_8_21_14_0_10_37_21]|uniref:Uncharacterized protein n=1 Tax=bacterium (Candidatus Gribaldobacteria) CG10_big_fil_rev_8_21_14_0_10_37_21 TaxID=2014275 RepID=A0A2H0UWB7_9BACT|nr:MAG: hypothetical protein AUJ25_00045 [Parcubacteria group bacterium CG1_02_37_13]PIR90479.1 MAG: hypothetical protein COU05_01845 [bacterium (Candidatus Gribaldobacteria) CG10_big_fil_rev_8_21_14_0_10_37_21]
MTQAILEKINNSILELKRETAVLRSFVVGTVGRDEEGEYRPEFVKEILSSSKDEKVFVFKRTDFLKKLRS